MRRYHRVSDLSKEKRDELLRFAQSRILPAGDVFRARLMLALAEGKTRSQIALELHTSRPTIARRKRRFEEGSTHWRCDVIARGVLTSVADLARKLRKYIRAYAHSAKPFRWTYTDPKRTIRPSC